MNVTEPLRRLAWLQPDQTALIGHDGNVLTYDALDRLLDLVGWEAERRGLGVGDVVGLDIGGLEQVQGTVVALGLARRGIATAVSLADGLRLHLTLRGQPANKGTAGESLDQFCESMAHGREDIPLGPIHPDDRALFRIFGSSGTTGLPKTFSVDHAMMAQRAYDGWHAMQPISRVHVPVSPHMGRGMRQVLRTLWAGGTLVFPTTEGFHAAALQHGITSLACGPALLARILDALPADAPPPSSLMRVEVGGATLPRKLRTLAEARLGCEIMNNFGASETAGIASAPMALIEDIPGAVGMLHPGVRAEAVDEADRPLPPGTEGLLRVRTPGQATGYRHDPVATARHFREGWFYTGDLGRVTAEGVLIVTGRAGDVINLSGRKVAPGPIEMALEEWPEVREAAAFAVPGANEVVELWAAVVVEGQLDTTALAAHLRQRLGPNAPQYLLQVTALPRNANGKLLRQDLAALARRERG